MFGTIRKHQTWLWAVIITLTIISFVIFFSPYSKMNDRVGQANLGSIYGKRITEEQYVQAQREVALRYFFMSGGRWPDENARNSGFDMERETYQWLFLTQKQEQLGIHIAEEIVAQVARDMLGQFERQGLSAPQAFVNQVLKPRGWPVDAFEGFVRHYIGIQEVIASVGMSGKLITPQEGRALYVREHEELVTEAVEFSASNYLSSVIVTQDALAQYYTNALARYRIPERFKVDYVKFDASNYLAEASQEMAKMTNLNERLEYIYQQRGTNYYADAKSPAEAKEKIREEMRKELALFTARQRANAFATVLLDMTNRLENLVVLAQASNLVVSTTAPFDRQDGPKDLDVSTDFTSKAFALSPTNDSFAGPIMGPEAAYVIGFKERLASVVPTLDQIRERVVADYRQQQAVTMARQAGMTFYPALTNGLAQGKSFSAICAEAKHKTVSIPPFSISSRQVESPLEDSLSLNELKQLAFSTLPGKASHLQPTSQGAVILSVKSKLPVDEAKLNTDLPAFLVRARQARQNEAFNEWFRKEAVKGLSDTPLARPKQTPEMSRSPAKS